MTSGLERAVRRSPEKVAFRCGDEELTFEQLHESSDRLAHWLIRNGIRPGDRVGIQLVRSVDYATAVYGVLKARAVYVPVDPHAPVEIVQGIVADCGVKCWLTHQSLRRQIQRLQRLEFTPLVGDLGQFYSGEAVELSTESYPEETDVAFIIYTSGTTGRPKGITHSHRSGASYAHLVALTYGINETDRIGSHAPLHFDMSMLGLFVGPLVGATTVIVPEAHTKLPASLSALMEAEALTVWYSVPLALVQMWERGMLEARDLSSLRWVLYAGEAFPPSTLAQLVKCWHWARFSNVYGPAETNQCTYYHISEVDPAAAVPIGWIWDETKGLIRDEDGNVGTDHCEGELLIHSSTMMQGYWNRPDLDDAAFEVGPDGLRYYCTGDRVRQSESGCLHLQGRTDRQIKIRGNRIELDALENVSMQHPGVYQGAAVASKAGENGLKLILFVVVREGAAVDSDELRAFLKRKLPPYSVPEKIQVVAELPRTSNDKVDYQRLSMLA